MSGCLIDDSSRECGKFCVTRFERSSFMARIVIILLKSERKFFYVNDTPRSHQRAY